jgi:hypothetical protein
MDNYELLSKDNDQVPMDLYFIAEGFVGQEASIAFREFVEKIEAQVTVEDILEGRRDDIISGFGINDANGMIDKLANSDEFKKKLSQDQLQNIVNFVTSISPELAMKAWEALTRSNGDNIAIMWSLKSSDGTTFGNYIKDIIGKPQES